MIFFCISHSCREGSIVSQNKLPQHYSATDPAVHDSNPKQEYPFDLIDLAAPNTSQDVSIVQNSYSPAFGSKSFVEDLAGLQPTPSDIPKPNLSKHSPAEHVSLLPSQIRSLKRNKRGGSRFDELSNNRCSTPESIASESESFRNKELFFIKKTFICKIFI